MREICKVRPSCLLVPAFLSGILAVAGCAQAPNASHGSSPSHDSSNAVSIVRPQRKALKRVVEQPGTVQAHEETQLFARVPGYVRKLRPEIDIGYRIHGPKYDAAGREVEPGEVLAEIAVPELKEEAKQKQASVHLAEAEVDQANKALAAGEAAIAVAQAMVLEAQANFERWESESKRMVGLVKGGVVDTQARDETLYQFQSASGKLASSKAVVDKAKADRDRAEADLRAARSRVDVARADALRSEAMLAYAQIRAPYDGIVTWRKVNTGNFVQPVAGQGDWLFKVAQVDPVRVVVGVPEMDAELVKEKAEAKITIQALPGHAFRGTVSRTSWALEPGARTLRTEIDLPNKEGLITPGMYAYAQVVCQLLEAWTLPTTSVAKQGDALVCFVIDGGTDRRMSVQVGRSDGQSVVVLKKQTSSSPPVWEDFTGTEVVAARAAGLTDGQAVQVETAGK